MDIPNRIEWMTLGPTEPLVKCPACLAVVAYSDAHQHFLMAHNCKMPPEERPESDE